MTEKPQISVVINTYNRLESIKTVLLALRYQTYGNFEVIVVNGPSTDGTEEYVKQFSDIKYGVCPELNLSKSRNIGIAMAAGEYVAFIDDDAIPEPEWLENLYKKISTSSVLAGVGGYVKNRSGVEFQAKTISIDRFNNLCSLSNLNGDSVIFPHCFRFYTTMGCNCIFKRYSLIQCKGFDEQYDYYLDETDLCARLIDCGYTIDYCSSAFVLHKFKESPLRDLRGFPLDWTKIIKNTIYFIRSYQDVCGKALCDDAIRKQIEMRKGSVQKALQWKTISQQEADISNQTIQKGLEEGERDAGRGYKLLISDRTLGKYASPFLFFSIYKEKQQRVIVFFVDSYPPAIMGGIGRFVHQMAVGMAKEGHQIHVITPAILDYDTVDFEDAVWVHRITFKQYPDHLLQRDTCPCDFFMPRMNQLYSYYEELLKIEERTHVDIVNTPIWDCLGFYALMDSRFHTIVSLQSCMKSVFTNPLTMPPEVKNYIQLENETLRRAQYIMPISNAIRCQLEKYYELELHKKSTIVNLGLKDLATGFIPQKRSDDKIEVLFLGRLEHRKGVDILLKTLPALAAKYPNLLIRFAGDNKILVPGKNITYEQEFFSVSGNEKYQANTCFEGVVSEERLQQLYAQCDIFVSPSRYESFGLIFLEAMMFAKPVIGCNAGGMPEVIGKHLETGLLAEPDSVESLTQCLDTLLGDSALREKIGTAGRKRYEELFTDEIMVKTALAYYEKILDGSLDHQKEH